MNHFKLLLPLAIFLNSPLALSDEYFAGHYFRFQGCNSVVLEDRVTFQKINIDEESAVRLTSMGAILTGFGGNYWGGSMRFGLYSNDQHRGKDYPSELIAETYNYFYYPQNDRLETPYRIDIPPVNPTNLEPGVYWIAATSNVNGQGTANTGCRQADGESSMILTRYETSPFFPVRLSEPFAFMHRRQSDLNFYILYDTRGHIEE